MTKILRLAVVLAMSLAALLGTMSLASAEPEHMPEQHHPTWSGPDALPVARQAACIVKQIITLLKEVDHHCKPTTPPPTGDVCPNIAGVQTTVPAGYTRDAKGNCVKTTPPPTDMCPNLTGDQATVPPGYTRDASGNCIPTDQDFDSTLTRSEPGTQTQTLTCPTGTIIVGKQLTLSPDPGTGPDQVGADLTQTTLTTATHTLTIADNPSGTTYTSTATITCGANDPGSQLGADPNRHQGNI